MIARGLVVRENRVLACRNLEHGHLFLPGGHVEPGEPASAALARECDEECGEPIRVGPLLLVAESLFEQQGRPRHEVNLVFHVEHAAGVWPERVTSREAHIGFAWLEPAMAQAELLPRVIGAWAADRCSGNRAQTPTAGWISDAS